jgi:hypothetical protein
MQPPLLERPAPVVTFRNRLGAFAKRPAPALVFGIFGRRIDLCRVVECVAVEAEQYSELGLANTQSICQHGIKQPSRVRMFPDRDLFTSSGFGSACESMR